MRENLLFSDRVKKGELQEAAGREREREAVSLLSRLISCRGVSNL